MPSEALLGVSEKEPEQINHSQFGKTLFKGRVLGVVHDNWREVASIST